MRHQIRSRNIATPTFRSHTSHLFLLSIVYHILLSSSMVNIRPATHAGSWYTNNGPRLKAQLDAYFEKARERTDSLGGQDTTGVIPGARVLIGPHAGFAYSGERLAETFNVWDTSNVKRVFVLGPSHHVYFKNVVMVSKYDFYETPFGNLPIDVSTTKELLGSRIHGRELFRGMSDEIDDDEHSFEMHAPFIHYACSHLDHMPQIVPIMISSLDERLKKDLTTALLPYFHNKENHFIVSSDFCHWGSRFGYTKYLPDITKPFAESDLVSLSSHKLATTTPIYKSIEALDKTAMEIASKGSVGDWESYISATGNTICGQKPIAIILRLLQGEKGFEWIGYSQSNEVHKVNDSSVSYASGYVVI